ncbi:hypothetical protein PSHT_08557 [Puccinia striiformis]|uniref:Uncharacterized protein n=1 Tax=Puccinia striiformis TaxID=27350 RepID=A0A2S4VMV8_9BASI|nr:hypothetical protein PSHT_08557 [Puccinia striiformis]
MSDQVQNNVNGSNPLSESYRLKYVEEENRALRDELATMKQLFQQVSMQSGAPPTSTKSSPAPASPAPRKSLTSKQLADLKRANAGHDLDKVDLDGVGNKLLTSCYNLACCLMNSALATSLVPSSPSITERQKIEGFLMYHPCLQVTLLATKSSSKMLDKFKRTAKLITTTFTAGRFGLVAQTEASRLSRDDHILMAVY